MNSSDLKFTGGRKLTDAQVVKVKKLGGFGPKWGPDGSVVRYVTTMPDEKGNQKVVNAEYPEFKRQNYTQEQKEHQQFLEDLMERESSGRHPRVKPSEAKQAGKRLKRYVEQGRKVQGVDV